MEKKHILIALAAIMLVVGSVLTVLLLVSCSTNRDKEILSELSGTVELNGSRVPVADSLMMGGFIVRCLDDNSAVIRYFGRPFILGYLSLNDCELKPLVYSGRGPGEMLEASSISYTSVSGTGHRLVGMSDINMKKHIVLDVDASLASGSASVVKDVSIPANTFSVFSIPEGFLYKVKDKDGFSYMSEVSGEDFHTVISLYPQGGAAKYYSYLESADCISPDGSKVVMCMACLNKIYIIDLAKGSITGVVTEREWKGRDDLQEAVRQSETGMEDHYMYACCDGDYIYALYNPGNELRVFDWKGNFINRIKLDHAAVSISISPSRQLYATDMEEGLFRYDLSNL